MISDECRNLIASIQTYQVTYSRRLFNHLPMILVALDQMKATPLQLRSSYEHYAERLTPRTEVVTLSDPIGQQFNQIQQDYLNQLEQLGLEQTLKTALPRLIPGIAAGAFYCVSRLACAIKTQDTAEVATALTCWQLYYLDVEGIKEAVDKKPLGLLRSATKIVTHYRFPAGNTVDRMASVLLLPDYQEMASQPQALNFNILAKAVVSAYQMTGDFTLCQGVIAVNALSELLPYIDDQEQALRNFWQALVLVYLSTGGVAMNAAEPVELIDWLEIRAFCCNSDNEHLIELCYACELLYQQTDDINCHKAASRIIIFNR